MLSRDVVKVSFCQLQTIYPRRSLKKNLREILYHLQKGKITRCNSLAYFLLSDFINASSASYKQR